MNGQMPQHPEPSFAIKDCTLIALATGLRASTLAELASALRSVPAESVYYHFWGTLLQSGFDEREYNNDFAAWVRHALRDRPLAERLAVLDPTDFPDLDALRDEVIDLVESGLEASERLTWLRGAYRFEFLRYQIVVFDTHRRIDDPGAMAEVIPTLSPSSIFYHFVDARRRNPDGLDDFRTWLTGLNDDNESLCAHLAGIDPYFGQLVDVRDDIAAGFCLHARPRESAA